MSIEILHYKRGNHIENIHRGDAVLVDSKGNLLKQLGNGKLNMFWRSAAKPFQLLEFVKLGGDLKFNITEEELAILVSSHSGEEIHTQTVEKILEKIDLNLEYLDCGSARPMSGKAFKDLVKLSKRPNPLHNPCSGKHTAILALCKFLNINPEEYTKPDHQVEKIIYNIVSMATEMENGQIEIGIDGCGVPVFYLPIDKMAYAYARLADAENGNWGEYTGAAIKIRNAMMKYPQMVSGTGRIDKAVTEITKGRIIAKIGSDAVYCLADTQKKVALTFKIEDGSYGAVTPTVIFMLYEFDLITDDEYKKLLELYPPVLKNHRGDIIGEIKKAF